MAAAGQAAAAAPPAPAPAPAPAVDLEAGKPAASSPASTPPTPRGADPASHGSPGGAAGGGGGVPFDFEQYRRGYPRLAAFIASDAQFFVCRPFSRLRARLLLRKQHELALLEEKLDEIDAGERKRRSLASLALDDNAERAAVLGEIDARLADYDRFLQRCHDLFALPPARPSVVQSIQNWMDLTGSIAREERAFLSREQGLLCLNISLDPVASQLEMLIERSLHRFSSLIKASALLRTARDDGSLLGLVSHPRGGGLDRRCTGARGLTARHSQVFKLRPSVDSDGVVYSALTTASSKTVRFVLTVLIIFVILTPMVVCNYVTSTSLRMLIVFVFTVVFLSMLSFWAHYRTSEVMLATATYAAVLIVFVSGTGKGDVAGT